MFEKEAEEYTKFVKFTKERWNCHEIFYADIELAYQKGAEKANEWHYIKDGIFPIHSYRVLVFTDEGVGFGIYGLDDKKWHTYDTGFEVIAWKEIVLPKENE